MKRLAQKLRDETVARRERFERAGRRAERAAAAREDAKPPRQADAKPPRQEPVPMGEATRAIVEACAAAFHVNANLLPFDLDAAGYQEARRLAAALLVARGVSNVKAFSLLRMSPAALREAVSFYQAALPRSPDFELAPAVLEACAHWRREKQSDVVAVRPNVRTIQTAVVNRFGVSLVDVLSSRRTAGIVRVRMLAVGLAKRLTLKSLPELGMLFGGRDHTTMLHSARKAERALDACNLTPAAPLPDWVEALHRVTGGGKTLNPTEGTGNAES